MKQSLYIDLLSEREIAPQMERIDAKAAGADPHKPARTVNLFKNNVDLLA